MEKRKFSYSQKTTNCYFDASLADLDQLADPSNTIIVTDEHIASLHAAKLEKWRMAVVPAGEEHKVQGTVDTIIGKLISYKADRKSFLVGVGGGVITDITGYTASIYMRGIGFGFAPTSLLAMVDASIGGKNGIDVGVYKNFLGVIRQPDFLLYDPAFLSTLPETEWVNGFAEIIKHACIGDEEMFEELERNDIGFYRNNTDAIAKLIKRNALIKSEIVQNDEFEQGERKLLNFGHTWGHAIETTLNIPHGHAVAIGMVVACRLSEKLKGFEGTERVIALLKKYDLPVEAEADKQKVFEVLSMDKKKEKSSMNYVLLKKIGKAKIQQLPLNELEQLIVHEN